MGVDLVIYCKKKDLKKLLNVGEGFVTWFKFDFLINNFCGIRWYRFKEMFNLETNDPITSKDLITHIAVHGCNFKNRREFVSILMEYDLLFAPDTASVEGDWIDLFYFWHFIKAFVTKNFDQIFEEFQKEADMLCDGA